MDFLSSKPHLPFRTTFRVGSLEGGQVGKPFVSFHNVHQCQCSLFNGKGDFVDWVKVLLTAAGPDRSLQAAAGQMERLQEVEAAWVHLVMTPRDPTFLTALYR